MRDRRYYRGPLWWAEQILAAACIAGGLTTILLVLYGAFS